MAGSVNKVILIGNLGADPEIKRTQDGRPIANLRIATSETWRDKNTGERKEKTEWHRVVIFSEGLCKIAEQYLKKGAKVYIEGQLQTRKWTDQSGVEKYSTEVVLQNFNSTLTMLDGRCRRRRGRVRQRRCRRRLRFGRRLRRRSAAGRCDGRGTRRHGRRNSVLIAFATIQAIRLCETSVRDQDVIRTQPSGLRMSLSPLLGAPLVVQLHAIAAMVALLLGIVQLIAPKGTLPHRTLGYVWVALLLTISVSSFWIHGHSWRLWRTWSPIHLLSIFAPLMLLAGVLAARRHNVRSHKITMISIFVGALVIAGLFTFVPGRVMHKVLFG